MFEYIKRDENKDSSPYRCKYEAVIDNTGDPIAVPNN